MNGIPDDDIRKKIFLVILNNPGLHRSGIAEILNVGVSLAEPYLKAMEEAGEIFSVEDEGLTKYYVKKRGGGTRERRTEDIRIKIFDLLLRHPGLYLSEIAEKLDMSAQLAEYHLSYMEKNDLVLGAKENGGYHKRFYTTDSAVGVKDKRILALLRQEHLLRIVLIILKYPHVKHKDLADYVGIHPSTLSHHLNRLEEYEIIDVFTYGKEKGYSIKDKKEILRIIRGYILDIITENFSDLWSDLSLK